MKKILKGLLSGILSLSFCFGIQAIPTNVIMARYQKAPTKGFKLVINNKIENVVCILSKGKWVIPQSLYKKYPKYNFRIDVKNLIIIATVKPTTIKPQKTQQYYGGIEGNITWQYNDYVGTKPDVDANIVLLKRGLKSSQIPKTDLEYLEITGGTFSTINSENIGMYGTKVDGTGHYKLDRIPVGDYILLIVSNKTKRNFNEPLDDYTMSVLTPIFGNKSRLYDMGLKLNKSKVTGIKIQKDYIQTISYDFGNTYI